MKRLVLAGCGPHSAAPPPTPPAPITPAPMRAEPPADAAVPVVQRNACVVGTRTGAPVPEGAYELRVYSRFPEQRTRITIE